MYPPPPRGLSSDPGPVSIDVLPVQLSPSSIDIDLAGPQPGLALPEIANGPEQHDHRKGQVALEETLSSADPSANGRDSSIELSDEDEEDDEKTEIRTIDTADGLERNLIKGMPVVRPSFAEADMSQADGAPGEEGSETRQSEQPIEDSRPSASKLT